MIEFLIALKDRLKLITDSNNETVFKTVSIWNNQIASIAASDNNLGIQLLPAVYIEVDNPNEIQTLGEGHQVYKDLIVSFHIAHRFDYTNENFDENLEVFNIARALYLNMQFAKVGKSSTFTRIQEEQDYDHPNVYHFIQRYRTTLVDTSYSDENHIMSEPIEDIETTIEYTAP